MKICVDEICPFCGNDTADFDDETCSYTCDLCGKTYNDPGEFTELEASDET